MMGAKEYFRKDNSKCNLCDEHDNQTTEHIVYECKGLEEFRSHNIKECDMASNETGQLKEILRIMNAFERLSF